MGSLSCHPGFGACGLDGGIERSREGYSMRRPLTTGCAAMERPSSGWRGGGAGPSSFPLGPLSVPSRVGAMLDNN